MKGWFGGVVLGVICSAAMLPGDVFAFSRGIYLTQNTAENTRKMQYLIRRAKETGIDTFVIDIYRSNKRYANNIALVKKNGIRYVARVVVFPYGGTRAQLHNRKYWEKRWQRAAKAVRLGADSIQLDYIRYNVKTRASRQNAHDVHRVIKFFKKKLEGTGVKLQIDVFGIAALKPSHTIGQNPGLFADTVDAICPMVYPSHYEPYRVHAVQPYETVLKSVLALKRQIKHRPNVNVYAYIELFNYRYPMKRVERQRYIRAQLKAARDAGADGWYAWSARNKYEILFNTLSRGG